MVTIEAVYEAFIDKIYNFCLYRTGNKVTAEDLAATTFMKFFKSDWRKVKNPTAYLYAICRNVIIDHYRKERPTVSLETLMEQGANFGETFDYDRRLEMYEIFTVVEALPEEQKEVIIMQYVQDLDNKTIAEILGKTESAIKSLAYRALETLRKELNTALLSPLKIRGGKEGL